MAKKDDNEYTSTNDPTPKRPWDPKTGTGTGGVKKGVNWTGKDERVRRYKKEKPSKKNFV